MVASIDLQILLRIRPYPTKGMALVMSYVHVHSQLSCITLQEVALIGMLAYLSYLCGDWLGLSGIVALFCCAVTISHYALHNVSSLSRVTTVSAFQTLSYVSEGAIFIYVGMDTLDPLKWQVGGSLRSTQILCRSSYDCSSLTLHLLTLSQCC